MLTEFGKELRKLRIDNNEKLMDMAERLGKSSAFISSVEVGKKSPPSKLEDAIIALYGLVDTAAERLRVAADRSRELFTLQPQSLVARDTAGLLARKINTLSDDQLERIRSIIGGEQD